jgi:hypothetical protein
MQSVYVENLATALYGRQIVLRLLGFYLATSVIGCVSLQWRDSEGNIQSIGALSYSIVETQSARIFAQTAWGLNIRAMSEDGGLAIGYRRYIAVQPCALGGCAGKPSEGTFRACDDVSKRAGLLFRKEVGLELGFGVLTNSLNIGYDKTMVIVKIDFSEDDLYATRFYQRKWRRP